MKIRRVLRDSSFFVCIVAYAHCKKSSQVCDNIKIALEEDICKALKAQGVIDRVIIHLPDMGVCLSDNGYTVVASLDLPKGYVKGSTGAGDAFCAGALLGIYKGWDDEKILSFASCSAAASLSKPDAVSGMTTEEEVYNLSKIYKRKQYCWAHKRCKPITYN